jgi:NADPH:quinone reductase and related Zn-dependent oxidoreductases
MNPEGDEVRTVVAASLNPIDRIIAAGRIAFRSLPVPAVAGLDGVATDGPGLRYFHSPKTPFGSFAERVPLDGAETAQVPAGLDPVTAAALGVPGIAAWLSTAQAARIAAGDSVLILGATGAVGRLAVQLARHLGATSVAGTARDTDGLALVERLGGSPVLISSDNDLDQDLAAIAGRGFDVVIDMLWGAPFATAVGHLAPGARIVQVGNSAGAQADLNALAVRNKGAVLMGHSNFLVTPEERMAAYGRVAELAAQRRLDVAADPVTFGDFEAVWRGEGPAKPVFTF